MFTIPPPRKSEKTIKVICLRENKISGNFSIDHSLLLTVTLKALPEMPKVVGWERNAKGKLAPKFVDLSATMDPAKWVYSNPICHIGFVPVVLLDYGLSLSYIEGLLFSLVHDETVFYRMMRGANNKEYRESLNKYSNCSKSCFSLSLS